MTLRKALTRRLKFSSFRFASTVAHKVQTHILANSPNARMHWDMYHKQLADPVVSMDLKKLETQWLNRMLLKNDQNKPKEEVPETEKKDEKTPEEKNEVPQDDTVEKSNKNVDATNESNGKASSSSSGNGAPPSNNGSGDGGSEDPKSKLA